MKSRSRVFVSKYVKSSGTRTPLFNDAPFVLHYSLCIEHRCEPDNQLVTVRVGGKCGGVFFGGKALSIS